MELNLSTPPPPPPQEQYPETPAPTGYQEVSQAAPLPASDTTTPTAFPSVAAEAVPTPLIPVKRRRIHMGRLLILLAVLGAVGTGLFYAGRYLYERFLTEPAADTATQSTGPFTYTGMISNQPFLFSYPAGWKVVQSTTGFTVSPTDVSFKSEGKDMPAYSVEILPLRMPLSSEQLAKAYITTSFKVILSQSTTSVGLAIPSYVVVTTHESLTFSTIKNGTFYMVVTQPVLDTTEDRITAKKAAQLFMSSIRFEE